MSLTSLMTRSLLRPLMGGTLTGVVNDGVLMDGPKDMDDSCVKCT